MQLRVMLAFFRTPNAVGLIIVAIGSQLKPLPVVYGNVALHMAPVKALCPLGRFISRRMEVWVTRMYLYKNQDQNQPILALETVDSMPKSADSMPKIGMWAWAIRPAGTYGLEGQ